MTAVREEHKQMVVNLIRNVGGELTLVDLHRAALFPSVLIQPVMRELIIEGKLQLRGQSTYVFAPSFVPVEPRAPAASEDFADGAIAPSGNGPRKRCVRCKQHHPLTMFPRLPGMTKPARICSACRNPAPASSSTTTPALPMPPIDLAGAIAFSPSPFLREHLARLLSTGFYGRDIREVCERLIADGVKRELLAAMALDHFSKGTT